MENGHAEHDHNSRAGHVEEPENCSRAVNEDVDCESREDAEGEVDWCEDEIGGRAEELAHAVSVIENASQEELIDAGLFELLETREVSFSGMLPHPSVYEMYDDDAKDWIIRWNNAFTVDESRRQDKLVEHEIRQSDKSLMISTFLIVLSFVMAIVAYVLSSNAVFAGLFVSYPILSLIGNVISPVFSKSSKHRVERERKDNERE